MPQGSMEENCPRQREKKAGTHPALSRTSQQAGECCQEMNSEGRGLCVGGGVGWGGGGESGQGLVGPKDFPLITNDTLTLSFPPVFPMLFGHSFPLPQAPKIALRDKIMYRVQLMTATGYQSIKPIGHGH